MRGTRHSPDGVLLDLPCNLARFAGIHERDMDLGDLQESGRLQATPRRSCRGDVSINHRLGITACTMLLSQGPSGNAHHEIRPAVSSQLPRLRAEADPMFPSLRLVLDGL